MPNFVSPAGSAVVGSGWGADRSYRGAGKTHEGIDFSVPVGTAVYAAAGGKVVTSAYLSDDPAGEMIAIDTDDGGGRIYRTRYMHLSKRLVVKGDKVYAGQLIGYSGNSGIKISAAHLHFDLRVNDKALLAHKAQYGSKNVGTSIGGYIAIPAETYIPANYSPKVKENASKRDIVMYAGGFGLTAILLLVGAYFIWKKF